MSQKFAKINAESLKIAKLSVPMQLLCRVN